MTPQLAGRQVAGIVPAPRPTLALFLILALGACGASNTERDFLCPAQMGSPCTTIAAADGAGSSDQAVQERGEDTLAGSLTQTPLSTGKAGKAGNAVPMGDGGFAYDAAAYRLGEKVGTLWIAPHAEGETLYEATFVHFLILPAAWGNQP